MTTLNEPDRPNGPHRPETDVDGVFADLVSSMPDLASIDAPVRDHDLEVVEVVIPHPHGTGQPLRIAIEVPSEVAGMVRAELSTDRIAAMMQAINALAAQSVPPKP